MSGLSESHEEELCPHALWLHTVMRAVNAWKRLMMQDPVGADRVVRHKTRHDEAFAKHVEEHDEREKKIARQFGRTRDDSQSAVIIIIIIIVKQWKQTEQRAMCSTGKKAMMVCTSKTRT